MFPDKAEDQKARARRRERPDQQPDREQKWFSFDGSKRSFAWWTFGTAQGRLVLGDLHRLLILMEGKSYLKTRRKRNLQVHHVFVQR
jgi:hypothetical protein